MTHTFAEGGIDCAECGGPLNEGSRFDRNAPAGGRVFRAVPGGSTAACDCLIHEHCLDEIRSVGSVNHTCPCGAGQIADGLPLEAATAGGHDAVAQPMLEPSDDDSDNSDDSDDDSDDDSSENESDGGSDESD